MKESEIAEINTIEIRVSQGTRDKRIRDYMRREKIDTVHKMEDNIRILREWATARGKKVRIIQEK